MYRAITQWALFFPLQDSLWELHIEVASGVTCPRPSLRQYPPLATLIVVLSSLIMGRPMSSVVGVVCLLSREAFQVPLLPPPNQLVTDDYLRMNFPVYHS